MTAHSASDVSALAKSLLSEAREEVTRADAKASTVLAGAGVMLSVVFTGLMTGPWSPSSLGLPFAGLFWIGIASALVGVALVGASIFPRTGNSSRHGCITYFGHAVGCDSIEELHSRLERTVADHMDRDEEQLYVISRIVDRKYRLMQWALVLFLVALILSLGAVAVGSAAREGGWPSTRCAELPPPRTARGVGESDRYFRRLPDQRTSQ
jgi:hypothetical protein